MPEAVGLVQQFVERTGQLYSLPAVAASVLRLTSEPRIDSRALKECIERDPALTTRILRVVNSSLFGVNRQVTDLNQALTLLGTRPLKMLVLGFSLPKELFAGLEASVLNRYWRRTLIKAVAARELAEQLCQAPGDEAFIAGLVQDIGMLALIQQLGESYQRFLEHVQAQGGGLLDREVESLGFDHVVLSARLLQHWGLPRNLCAAVSVPPDEARIAALPPGERVLPQVLHLAELLARLIEQPYGTALRDLLAVGGRYCGLTYEKLQPVVADLQQKVEELAEVLALELPEGKSYIDLLLASQQQLAGEAELLVQMARPADEDKLLALATDMRSELAAACGGTVAAPRTSTPTHRVSEARPALPTRSVSEGRPGTQTGNASEASPRRPTHAKAAAATVASGTAIADDPGLGGCVAAAIQRCRQARCPLTLALFEIDCYSDLLSKLGPAKATEIVHGLKLALADWTSQRAAAVLVTDSSYALVWEECPRNEALRLVRQALREVKPWFANQTPAAAEIRLSAGLATLEFPPKNFPAQELIDVAERCLHGAQLSGGDTVKSIEL